MNEEDTSKNELVDIFISYRRQGGATVAALLNNILRQRGFQVFMDVESLQAGNYNQAIKKSIASAKDFLLIVSHGVFDSEWVLTEIAEALRLGKNIHPVFVNGLDKFPTPIPDTIKEIGNLDGVIMNERHFAENFTKLQLRFSTKNKILLDKIIGQWHPEHSTALFLCEALLNIFDDEEVSAEMINEFGKFLRQRWLTKDIDHQAMINAIGDHLIDSLDDLKGIAQELGVPARGSKKRVLYNLGIWLKADEDGEQAEFKRLEKLNEDYDRYKVLKDTLADLFRSGEDLSTLKSIARNLIENYGFKISSWQSSSLIFLDICDQVTSVEDLFELLNLNQEQTKLIALCTILTDKGKKQELQQKIIDWADYSSDA
jgi:hypothetical protein